MLSRSNTQIPAQWKGLRIVEIKEHNDCTPASSLPITSTKHRFLFILSLFFILCAGATPPAEAASRTVTVGVYENAPKVFTSESGKPSGIFIDIIEHIAKSEGWKLRYVSGTWAEGLDRLAKGEIDLMPDVAYTAEREKIYSFHKIPVLTVWSQVYARRGSGIQSILDLNGKRIAALEQTIQLETFKRLTNSFGLNITLIPVPDYKTEFEMLAAGKADAGLTNRLYGLMYARKYGLEDTPDHVRSCPLLLCGARNAPRQLLDVIDRHLIRSEKRPSIGILRAMKRWTSEEVHFRLPAWVKILGLVFGAATVLVLSLVIRNSMPQSRPPEGKGICRNHHRQRARRILCDRCRRETYPVEPVPGKAQRSFRR